MYIKLSKYINDTKKMLINKNRHKIAATVLWITRQSRHHSIMNYKQIIKDYELKANQ